MKKINFNKSWHFVLNDGLDWDAKIEKWDEVVDLPHDFSIIQPRCEAAPSGAHGGFFQGGVGKYKKSFKAKRKKKYFILCDGAFGITDLYINSNVAYTNHYGYNPFFVDITNYLRYDKENEILFRVNNTALPNSRWYSGAGIYRDVYLCECGDVYIHPYGTFVRSENMFGSTAYMCAEVSVYAEKNEKGIVEFEVFEDKKRHPVAKFAKNVVLRPGENKVLAKFQIENPRLWDTNNPNMYKIKTTAIFDGASDVDESVFGIRFVNIDSERGFMLNGKSIKLRGGCIHHDQVALGTAVYRETEYRRVARLKEAGFNAVRMSHNPQSPYFYEACDRLGMLVMDELFDLWSEGKKENDFHFYFKDRWEAWVDFIVRRNRCHPSIVMWSTGNEIPQKTGRGGGYYIATDIASKIRFLDSSRPITHALCSLWDNSEEYELEKAENDFSAEVLACFARATAVTADTCDIIGYNYLEYRLEKDLARFPNRVIINTETFPLCAYTTIKQLLGNPRIAGDFVWTAWDYFGETALGHVEYNEKRGDFMLSFPYHIANCGDIDMLGNRKPQSYYREIAWELRRDPYIAVRHPDLCSTPYFISGWGFYECEHSWCFEGCEGKACEIYVFADCDKVVLELNGKIVGETVGGENGVFKFNIPYQSGALTAYAYVGENLIGSSSVCTEGEADHIVLKQEKSYTGGDIIYVDTEIQDKNGALCTQASVDVSYSITGGKILGTISGNLTTDHIYNKSDCKTEKGKSLLVLKKTEKVATLCARAEGFAPVTVEL